MSSTMHRMNQRPQSYLTNAPKNRFLDYSRDALRVNPEQVE